MGSFGHDHDAAWAATSIAASSITNGSNAATGAISNDGKLDTEVSVEVAYGATASAGVIVSVERDVDGTNYEATADQPFSFTMPNTVSTTHRRVFTIPGHIGTSRVRLTNPSGATVTATVRTRSAMGVTA